jgi:hypothetical protein
MPVRYTPKKISEITERDSFISVTGRVETVGNNFFVVDDGQKLEVVSEEALERGKLVRVFCSRLEGRWKADIVQNLGELDLEMFEKAEEVYRKIIS